VTSSSSGTGADRRDVEVRRFVEAYRDGLLAVQQSRLMPACSRGGAG